jgi:hypothetical protein
MNIAFITNYEKTIYFHRIACRLEAEGHRVFWIAPSNHWAQWLRGEGVADSSIIDLTRFARAWQDGSTSDADRRRLVDIEDRTALRFNDVTLMDRLLRLKSPEVVTAYYAVMTQEIGSFLEDHNIAVVFGEQTFGVEIVTSMLCTVQNRALLVPHPVRVPSKRIGFFRGHLQAQLAEYRDVDATYLQAATEFLSHFRANRPRPEYFDRYNKPPMPRGNWPAKLLKHIRLDLRDPFDETHFSARWLLKKRSSEVLNAIAHRVEKPYWVPPQSARRPFVLFPLHRQPESSIDVLASRASNQVEVVRALARTLPATHDLYVKEHPNGLGDRSRRELCEFRAIPSVKLVDPAVSSFALLDTADLVIAISGTAAYEAALLGRRAATIANMFFGSILLANEVNPYEDSVADLLRRPGSTTDEERVAFLAKVFANSFEGLIDNPNFTPNVLDDANIKSVARGFSQLLSSERH